LCTLGVATPDREVPVTRTTSTVLIKGQIRGTVVVHVCIIFQSQTSHRLIVTSLTPCCAGGTIIAITLHLVPTIQVIVGRKFLVSKDEAKNYVRKKFLREVILDSLRIGA